MNQMINQEIKYILEENERLIKKIQKLETENRKLKEEIKTLTKRGL